MSYTEKVVFKDIFSKTNYYNRKLTKERCQAVIDILKMISTTM